MSIQPLPAEVIAKIRSGVAIDSVVQCVEELVQNAIDAGATCIAVRLDLQFYKIQVVDNGRGMDKNDLQMLGERYATSKCRSLNELDKSCYYGYRGEALASICNVSQLVTIVTKVIGGKATYVKSFCDGECSISSDRNERPSCGVTVTVGGFLSKLPVRQAMINDVLEVEKVRRFIEALAIAHPGISFSLHNDGSNALCLRVPKTTSSAMTFAHLFGSFWVSSFRSFLATEGKFTLKGFFSLKGHRYKNLQFLYVHRRRIVDGKVQQIIDRQFSKASGNLSKSDSPTEGSELLSPENGSTENFPVFILEIECPRRYVDIGLHPSKSVVRFRHYDALIELTKRSVSEFLSANSANTGLYMQMVAECTNEGKPTHSPLDIDVHHCKHVLQSLPARRSPMADEARNPRVDDNHDHKMTTASLSLRVPDPRYTQLKPHQGSAPLEVSAEEVFNHVASPLGSVQPFHEIKGHTKIGLASGMIYGTTPLGGLVNRCSRQERMTKALADLKKFSCGGPAQRLQYIPPNVRECTTKDQRAIVEEQRVSNTIDRMTALPKRGGTAKILGPSLSKRICMASSVQQKITAENHTDAREFAQVPFPGATQPFDTMVSTQGFHVPYPPEVPSIDVKNNSFADYRCSAEVKSVDTPVCVLPAFQNDGHCVVGDSIVPTERPTLWTSIDQDVQSSIVSVLSLGVNDSSDSLPCAQPKKTRPMEQLDDGGSFHDSLSSIIPCSPPNLHLEKPKPQNDSVKSVCPNQIPEKIEDDWLLSIDPMSKRDIYVHPATGHSYFGQPPSPENVAWFGTMIPGRPLMLDVVTNSSPRLATSALPYRPWRNDCHENARYHDTEKVPQLSDQTVKSLLQTWKNPIFKVDPLELQDTPLVVTAMKCGEYASETLHSMTQPYSFTKDIFRTLNVITQVDKKYILCSIGNLLLNDSAMVPSQTKLLVMFDQHAVHERIRLEDLIAAAVIYDNVAEDGLPRLKSLALEPPLRLGLSANVARTSLAFKMQLLPKGLEISSGEDDASIRVHRVPGCLFQREISECKMKRQSVIAGLVENLICDLVQMLESTGSLGSTMPKVVLDVLKSQACHGAVKFGEQLDLEDLRQLMAKLSECKLPFHCAHGRPSVVPLVDFSLLQSEDEEMKPSLWKLTACS